MEMFYEVSKDEDVIFTSGFINGIGSHEIGNVFTDFFEIDNYKDFVNHPDLEEFIDCVGSMLVEQFEDIDDLTIYVTFCDGEGILSHSIVFEGCDCGVIDWKENGHTFTVNMEEYMDDKIYAKEYAAAIVDIFEDFLEEKGIEIPNDEHEGDEGEAIIYGNDFDLLMERITETIKHLCEDIGCEVDTDYWGN